MADVKQIKSIEDDIRDIINWLVVYEEEFGIEPEAVDAVRDRLEKLARKVGDLK